MPRLNGLYSSLWASRAGIAPRSWGRRDGGAVRLLVLGRVCDLCASSASRVDPQATQRLDAASFWPCTGSDPRTLFTRNALLTLGRCSDRYFRQTIKPHYHERQLHLARVLGLRLSLGKDLCPEISPAEARKAEGEREGKGLCGLMGSYPKRAMRPKGTSLLTIGAISGIPEIMIDGRSPRAGNGRGTERGGFCHLEQYPSDPNRPHTPAARPSMVCM